MAQLISSKSGTQPRGLSTRRKLKTLIRQQMPTTCLPVFCKAGTTGVRVRTLPEEDDLVYFPDIRSLPRTGPYTHSIFIDQTRQRTQAP